MSFFVLVSRDIRSEHLELVLGRIRDRLGESSGNQAGRRNSRVFQQLDNPTRLLTVSEWRDESSFDHASWQPEANQIDELGGSLPIVTPLVPLIRFEHMARRATIGSCVTISVSSENAPALQAFLVGHVHQTYKTVQGIVSREVFRAREQPNTFVVVHSWVSLADLRRFRATGAIEMDKTHAELETTMTAFTGALAAEFSALNPAT